MSEIRQSRRRPHGWNRHIAPAAPRPRDQCVLCLRDCAVVSRWSSQLTRIPVNPGSAVVEARMRRGVWRRTSPSCRCCYAGGTIAGSRAFALLTQIIATIPRSISIGTDTGTEKSCWRIVTRRLRRFRTGSDLRFSSSAAAVQLSFRPLLPVNADEPLHRVVNLKSCGMKPNKKKGITDGRTWV